MPTLRALLQMDKYFVYTIVLNYRNYLDTIECVESLLLMDEASTNRIVVVDNNSPNESCFEIENWLRKSKQKYAVFDHLPLDSEIAIDANILFVQHNQNNGYASGNNVGIKTAILDINCKYVWILNNDTTVDFNALARQKSYFDHSASLNANLGMLGSKILYYHNPTIVQCIGCRYNKVLGLPRQIGLNATIEDLKYDEKPFDYVSGASIFTSKDIFTQVGNFNEDFFLYFEEIDFATRLKSHGYTVGVCLESIVYHKEGASTKDDPKSALASPFSDYHFTRSKLIFTKKFYPEYLFYNYLSLTLVILNRIRRRQFENIWPIIKAGLKK